MGFRDIVVTLVVLCCIPYSFTRPFFGFLVFTWLAYMRPQDLCWGFAKTIRFSLGIALGMYVGWFLFETRKFTRFAPPMKWLTAFIICLTISLLSLLWEVRLSEDRQFSKYFDLLKVIAVTYFAVGMVTDKKRLDQTFWTVALSLGFFGIKYGLHGILRGGRILQGPGGMMLDNNDLCLAMAMNIPLLFFMGRKAERTWVRRFCYVAVALTCVTVICTLSRGGFLTMCLAGLLILNKLRKSMTPWIVAGVIGAVALLAMPADVKERLATLKDPESEGSAAGRLHAWSVGLRMVAAHPFFGVGFEGFLSNFRRYDPIQVRLKDQINSVRVAHNTYVQVWAELGTFALISFMGMLFSALLMLRKTRRMARKRHAPAWVFTYADMIEITLICFMFGANFLNRAHFDLMYLLVALSCVLWYVTVAELEAAERAPALAEEPVEPTPRTRPAYATP